MTTTLGHLSGTRGRLVDCAVVVVSYNNTAGLAGLLGSLSAAADGLVLDVVVVDNGSEADPGPVVARHPGARLVRAGANLGYSGGINLGMRHACPSEVVLVVNPDVVLGPGTVRALAAAAGEHGAAVPVVVDGAERRTNSLRREPTVTRALGEAIAGNHLPGRPAWLSEVVREPAHYETRTSVDWATGAVVAVRTHLADAVGAWDERRFFLYSEETDYCRRIRDAGGRVVLEPDAVARHDEGGSGRSDALEALLAVNRVRYYRKHHGSGPASVMFLGAVALRHLLRVHRPGDRLALAALVLPATRRALPGEPRP